MVSEGLVRLLWDQLRTSTEFARIVDCQMGGLHNRRLVWQPETLALYGWDGFYQYWVTLEPLQAGADLLLTIHAPISRRTEAQRLPVSATLLAAARAASTLKDTP